DSLKVALKQEDGLIMKPYKGDSVESFDLDDQSSVKRFFIDQRNGEALKEHLVSFENNVLAVDSGINSTFRLTVNNTIVLSSRRNALTQNFNDIFFNNVSVVTALAVLSKFRNEVCIFCNELLTYCDVQVPDNSPHMYLNK